MQKRHTFTVSTLIRRAKANKAGEAPIFLRVSINKESVELSSNHYIDPELWDSSQGRVKGRTAQDKRINEDLDNLVLSCRYYHYNQLQTFGHHITTTVIKNMLLDKHEKQHTLLAQFDKMVVDAEPYSSKHSYLFRQKAQ